MNGNELFELIKKACSVHSDKSRSAYMILDACDFTDEQLVDAFKYAQMAKVYGHIGKDILKNTYYNHCREECFNILKK
jgi:hypothetical protein